MIGITTYMEDLNRFPIIKKSFDSLIKTISSDKIIVVDDCSPLKEHIEYIKSLGISVIERTENRGLAKNKNLLIKSILDQGQDIGFLADDDNLYEQGRVEQYTEAIQKTGYDHRSLWLGLLTLDGSKLPSGDMQEINGYKFRKTPLVNGCFVTFTRRMIEKMGYYPELPHKLGHEHSIFTCRAIHNGIIPMFIDVLNPKVSNLQIIDDNYVLSNKEAYIYENLVENAKMFNKHYDIYQSYHD